MPARNIAGSAERQSARRSIPHHRDNRLQLSALVFQLAPLIIERPYLLLQIITLSCQRLNRILQGLCIR